MYGAPPQVTTPVSVQTEVVEDFVAPLQEVIGCAEEVTTITGQVGQWLIVVKGAGTIFVTVTAFGHTP